LTPLPDSVRIIATTPPRWLVAAETALLLAAPFVYWRMPHDFGSDGYLRLEATRYLAHGELLETPYSLMMSIVALPVYLFGDILAQFNVFVLFSGLAAWAAILWRHVPVTILRRAALIVLACSMFGHHSQSFFGEVLTAMCVTVGLALIVIRHATLGHSELP
jgi:hypothetical protein